VDKLQEAYKQALINARSEKFSQAVVKNADEVFQDCCKKISINPEMTFFDGDKSIYQIRIIRDEIAGLSLIKDMISLKTLRSLISNNVNYDKFVSYIQKNKVIKNPYVNHHYGFYYRKSGMILPLNKNAFNQEKVSFNKVSGEIKIYQKLPEIKADSVLELLIHAITPDWNAFIDWLAVYAMEHRKGLKKAHLALYGEYCLPLVIIIESIYPTGFYRYDSNRLPQLLKYNNWTAKCCFYSTVRQNYNTLSPFLNYMAQPIITSNGKLIHSDCSLVFHINKLKPIQSVDSKCINIKLYSKAEIEQNLIRLGMENFAQIIADQIGNFCHKSLHSRYQLLSQVPELVSNCWGVDVQELDNLDSAELHEFNRNMIKSASKSDNSLIEKHYKQFAKNNIISELIVKWYCIKYAVNYKHFISYAKELNLYSKLPFIFTVDLTEYNGFKLMKKIY